MKFKKVKSIIVIFILAISMLYVMPSTAQAVGSKVYYTTDSNINVGQDFNIYVNAENLTDLYGHQINFSFDPTLIQVNSIQAGSFYDGKVADTDYMILNQTPAGGFASAAIFLLGNQPGLNVPVASQLFVIKAHALKTGTIALNTVTDNSVLSATGNNVCVKLSDSTGGQIGGVTYESSSINIINAPVAPTGLTGTLSGTSALLNWAQNTDPAVTQYKIYRSTTSGSNYQLITTVSKPTITYTDTTVSAGTTYYYVITAVSSTGIESLKSNQISVVVGTPTTENNIINTTNKRIYNVTSSNDIKALIADLKDGGGDAFLMGNSNSKYYNPNNKLKLQTAEIIRLLIAAGVDIKSPAAIKTYIIAHAASVITAVKIETDKVTTQTVDTSTYTKVPPAIAGLSTELANSSKGITTVEPTIATNTLKNVTDSSLVSIFPYKGIEEVILDMSK